MPDDKRKEWIEYLMSLRESNYDYHHHKETVTFTIAGLYIGAILTIDFKGEEAPYIWGIVGFVALFLVRYQFYWRYRANAIVLACNKLLTELISGTAFQENEWKLDSDKSFPDSCRPIALNKAIKECRKPWAGLWKSPAFLEVVIIAAIVMSFLFAWKRAG